MLGLGLNLVKTRPPLVAGFSPPDIAGLKYWIDASQITGLANNDPVASWTDLASGIVVSQATASKRPLYKTAQINSLPAVQFDGVDDYLEDTTTTILNGVNGATVFLVASFEKNSNQFFFHKKNSIGMQQFSAQFYNYSSGGNYGNYTPTAGSLSQHDFLYDGTQTGNANRLKAWFNGSQQTLGFLGTIDATLPNGSGISIGALGTPEAYLNGQIAELLIYDRALTSAEQAVIRAYLQPKWGTP